MSARRPDAGNWRRGGAARGRSVTQYNDSEKPTRILARKDATHTGSLVRSSSPSDAVRYDGENNDRISRVSNGHRGASYLLPESTKSHDRGFQSVRGRRPGNMEESGLSTILRQIRNYDQEAFEWLCSNGEVPKLTLKAVKGMEKVSEQLRMENCGGFLNGIWEADEPLSLAANRLAEEMQMSFLELDNYLRHALKEVTKDLAEGFYLLFSVLHGDIPSVTQESIGNILSSAALIGMNHGNPHMVLSCTTDHLEDAENDRVLLVMQHVLFKVIDCDVDGSKLFGRAHRILDIQMELFESRDDEATAISALKVIAIISVRHPQAFKTRFGDLMDLFIGWYVDAMPNESVFEACVSAFSLFREKFKQEIDFAMKMVKQFSVEIETVATEFRKVKVGSVEGRKLQQSFVTFTQLTSLIFHAVTDKFRGTQRPADGHIRTTAKAAVQVILKSFNSLSSPSNQDSLEFSAKVDAALVVIVQAMSAQIGSISPQLYLHARMQQTSAQRISDLLRGHISFVHSYLSYVLAVLKSTADSFPLDVAKDLMGPASLIFQASADRTYHVVLEKLFAAVLRSASPAVKSSVMRTYATEYGRALEILTGMRKPSDKETASPPSAGVSRRFVDESLFVTTAVVMEPLRKVAESNIFDLQLIPDEVAQRCPDEDTSQVNREKCMFFLTLIKLSLQPDQIFEADLFDTVYHGFVSLDPTSLSSLPELLVSQIGVAKILWTKKCATLIVKDLISFNALQAAEMAFLRVTFQFLNQMVALNSLDVIMELVVDWVCDALRTVLAFRTSLVDLGIHEDYMRLVAHLFYFAFTGDENRKSLATTHLTELLRPHGDILGSVIKKPLIELVTFAFTSKEEALRGLAEALFFSSSLQTVLKLSEYLGSSTTAEDDGNRGDLIHLLPNRRVQQMPVGRHVRLWSQFVFTHPTSSDYEFGPTLLCMLLGIPAPSESVSTSQVVKSICGNDQWTQIVSDNRDLEFQFVSSVLCSSVCRNKGVGLFSTVRSLVLLIQALFQVHVPVVFDHTTFVHKTLLDVYIIAKDASLDIGDDFELLKRVLVESDDKTDGDNISNKATEKRRIYSKTAGITAQDVSNPRLSAIDRDKLVQRTIYLAEAMETILEQMTFGSCLHSNAASDEEWAMHMESVKALYSSEQQLKDVNELLRTLRTEILRVSIARNDQHRIARLGYPVLLEILETGESPQGINPDVLATKTIEALIELRGTDLIHHLSEYQNIKEISLGISELVFTAAGAMAAERWSDAVDLILTARGEEENEMMLDEQETDMLSSCFEKLNDWENLHSFLASKEDRNKRQTDLLFIAECKAFDHLDLAAKQPGVSDTLFRLLGNGFRNCTDAAEIVAILPRSDLYPNLLQRAHEKLKESLQNEIAAQSLKIPVKACIVLHGLTRLIEAENPVDKIHTFPLMFKTPNISHLEIDVQHTACRFLCGERSFHERQTTIWWDSELYLSVVRSGRRTGNLKVAHNYLSGFFSGFILDEVDAVNGLPDLLCRAAEAVISPKERELIRQGGKYYTDVGQNGYPHALSVLRRNCLHALKAVSEYQTDVDGNLVEVVRNLRCLEHLHRAATDGDEIFSRDFSEATLELRDGVESLYQRSGYPAGMFVDSVAVSGYIRSQEAVSGMFRELAYMTHCLEGAYTKPALEFGNWCYEQAFSVLGSLYELDPATVLTSLAEASPDLELSELDHSTVASVISFFIDSLSVGTGHRKVKIESQFFAGNVTSVDEVINAKYGTEFLESVAVTVLLDYLRQFSSSVLNLLVHAAHLYFVYLRSPVGPDNTAMVILRILELLYAYPSELHPIFMDEISKIDITPWKDFATQSISGLQHPNHLVTECLTLLLSNLFQKHPSDLIYPITLGRMCAKDANLGGGLCYPQLTSDQKLRMYSAFDNIVLGLPSDAANTLAEAELFSAEVQRISLLWEERLFLWLVSQQNQLKRQVKGAIKAGLNGHRGQLQHGESLDSLVNLDSESTDISSHSQYVSEMNVGPAGTSGSGFVLENVPAEGDSIVDDEVAPAVGSVPVPRRETPDISEVQNKKKEKRYSRFPVEEELSWTKRFDYSAYKMAIAPLLRKFNLFLAVFRRPPDTSVEAEFQKFMLPKIEEALSVIADLPFKVEFDEEVLWAAVDNFVKLLERRLTSYRHQGLLMGQISKMKEITLRCRSLPVPGHVVSPGGNPVFIDDFDDLIAILPTKTKPKKIALRGTDGQRYVLLCKGLEDLNQDNRIMQLMNVANCFLDRKFKHTQQMARVRTYSVVPFGPRAGLIQWLEGSTSLLSLYRSYLERETYLGRQFFPVRDETVVEAPVYGQIKVQDDRRTAQVATFRVTEEELQDIYEEVQSKKYEKNTSSITVKAPGDLGLMERDSELIDGDDIFEEKFSPKEFVDEYYDTFLRSNRNELAKVRKKISGPVRSHPNIHDLHLSYLIKSLRNDPSFGWENLKHHGSNINNDVGIEHFRNALSGLIEATPKDLLSRELWMACSSSEEWWKISRNYASSLAITSVLGHVIGLGDRHPDNVLFDFETGDVVHVDYNVAFDRGLRLSVPERVPYRLTQNLVSALGPAGLKGEFRSVAIRSLESLRDNSSVFTSLMSVCVHDPMVDWTTDRSDQVGLYPAVAKRDSSLQLQKRSAALQHGMKVYSKFREKLGDTDSGTAASTNSADHVDRTISEATDLTNLARMFEGWVAWL